MEKKLVISLLVLFRASHADEEDESAIDDEEPHNTLATYAKIPCFRNHTTTKRTENALTATTSTSSELKTQPHRKDKTPSLSLREVAGPLHNGNSRKHRTMKNRGESLNLTLTRRHHHRSRLAVQPNRGCLIDLPEGSLRPPDVTLPGAELRIRRETNLQDVKHIGVERDERIGSKDKNQEGGREKLPSAPLILAYAKDHIPHFLGDYQSYFELIPVDLVVNATIAAMSKHGRGNVPELKLYNVTSKSHPNPLRLGELMDFFSQQYLCDSPLRETTKDLDRIKFHSSIESFTSYVSNTIAKQERETKNGGGEAESHSPLYMKGKRKLKNF
ncbi:hypothetical protein YC2023_077738 [Brassica napus]